MSDNFQPCIECGHPVEQDGDELCPHCWNKSIEAKNNERKAKIAAGWIVDPTGAVFPPNE